MKKNQSIHGLSPCSFKMLRIMKLTVFLMLISFVSVFASETYSQTTRLTLKAEAERLEDFLNKIEKQSEFRFFYSAKIDVDQKVSGDFKNNKITEILDGIKDEAGINYEVTGRQIILSPIAVEDSGEKPIAGVQQKAISGKIIDDTGQPVPGVTVVVKGTTHGTITDVDGNYSLSNIPDGAILRFSFIGMKAQEITVGDQITINITMVFDSIGLEEVVTIGYGTRKRANLTGAVDQVSGEKLSERPVANITQALQGVMPGLNIKSNGGDPRKNPEINIRGFNSINGGSPLILVDGIAGNINAINPNDIESISVLKDVASAAIYGARGAFGVILITTKKGSAGQPTISYSNNFGWTTNTTRTDFESDPYVHAKAQQDAIYGYNGGSYTGFDDEDW